MKRTLRALGVVVLFLTTLVIPTAVRADGGGAGAGCGGTMCKP